MMKELYTTPKVTKLLVKHEIGIMTTSYSTVSFGDNNNPFNPQIDDWENNNIGTEQFEL